jgi:hypothetical protein
LALGILSEEYSVINAVTFLFQPSLFAAYSIERETGLVGVNNYFLKIFSFIISIAINALKTVVFNNNKYNNNNNI